MKQAPSVESDANALLERVLRIGAEGIELLRIIPHLHIAWLTSEQLRPEDRTQVLELARARGIAPGGAAHRLLAAWLEERPSEEFFAAALARLKSILLDLPADAQSGSKGDLIAYLLFLDRLALDVRSRHAIVGVARRAAPPHAGLAVERRNTRNANRRL